MLHVAMLFRAAVIAVTILAPGTCLAADDWLIGTWTGTIGNGWKADNGIRDFRVARLNDDGSFMAGWGTRGTVGAIGTGKVDGAAVEMSIDSGSVVHLRRDGDDKLVGTFVPPKSQASFPVTIVRKSRSWKASVVDGPSGGCEYKYYDRDGNPQGNRHIQDGESEKYFGYGAGAKMLLCSAGKMVSVPQ